MQQYQSTVTTIALLEILIVKLKKMKLLKYIAFYLNSLEAIKESSFQQGNMNCVQCALYKPNAVSLT